MDWSPQPGKRGTPRAIPRSSSPQARRYAAYPGGHAEGYPDTFVQLFRDFYEYIEAGNLKAPRTFPTFETGNEEMVLCRSDRTEFQIARSVAVGNPLSFK